MDREKLERLVGRAILDPKFRKRLLGEEGHERIVDEFKLTREEQEFLAGIDLTDGIPMLFDQGQLGEVMACGFMPRASDAAIG